MTFTTTNYRWGSLIVLLCVIVTISLAHKQNFLHSPFAPSAAIENSAVHNKTATVVAIAPAPQTTPQINIPQNVIAGGGGTSSQGNYRVDGTVGQSVAGTQMTNGQYSLTGGFWQGQSAIATPSPTPTPTPTPSPSPSPTPTPTPALQLILEESGPAPDAATAFDSILHTRDPFQVVNPNNYITLPSDVNTRVKVFVRNLQLNSGEPFSAVVVNLIDGFGVSYDVPAENVRPVPNMDFTQLIFRLPDNLSPGTCSIRITFHSQTSNIGTIRIRL